MNLNAKSVVVLANIEHVVAAAPKKKTMLLPNVDPEAEVKVVKNKEAVVARIPKKKIIISKAHQKPEVLVIANKGIVVTANREILVVVVLQT